MLTHTRQRWIAAGFALLTGIGITPPMGWSEDAPPAVRVGHFPNVTHAQAVVGRTNGWFAERMDAPIEWKHFNAGPSAMEALLAVALDLAYVGPSPAINVYARSQGKAIRIVSGSASGGARLIIREGSTITKPEDFRGKKVAAPEIGNTQDVALRRWLKSYGLKPVTQGGDVQVLAVKNPEILSLFQQGSLDAAWVPEPWATRLIQEAGGEVFLDERTLWPDGQFTTVVLVVRTEFLEQHRDVVEQFVRAHIELTEWIGQHPDETKASLNQGLTAWLGQPIPTDVLDESYAQLTITVDPVAASMATSAAWAWELGYVPGTAAPDLQGLFDLSILNHQLEALGRSGVAINTVR